MVASGITRRSATPGHTAKYNEIKLMYFEEFQYIHDAIAREKELKGWRREKKTGVDRRR